MSEVDVRPAGEAEPDDVGLSNLLHADPRWTSRYDGWQVIGRGAFATVVKTHCKDLGADVAVKVFKNLDPEDRGRFQQEIRNAQALDSEGVVRMYSPFWGSPPWIEMEWVDGPNLKQELQRRAAENDPFPMLEALAVAISIAEVLRLAHEKKIVHRDVKPANILLPRSRQPLVKLADFGIARSDEAGRQTRTGAFRGTPQFGSPESFIGDVPASTAHDVYSLGLCLYLIFTNNRFPWKVAFDAGMHTWMRLHVHVAPANGRRHVPTLDRALDDLLLRCLRKKAAKRPSMSEIVRDLRRIRDRLVADAAVAQLAMAAPPRARRRQAATAAGTALLLIGGALAARVGSSGAPAEGRVAATPSAKAPPWVVPTGPAATQSPSQSRSRGALHDPTLSLRGQAVQLRNGQDPIGNIRLQVETDSGTLHLCRLVSPLAPSEETFCSFSDFEPEIVPPAKPAHAEVRFTSPSGSKSLKAELR